ncbi:MAG TPA: spore coat protein U domain-containing protein [Variovorax sp.]|nr:spore coat protein U domain-containing protein [Variovorax sp.]
MFKKALIAGAVALATIGSAHAAGSSSGMLDVKLNVTTGCDINGGSGIGVGTGQAAMLDFGTHAPGATAVAGTTPNSGATALVITCSGTQTPTLSFDGGVNASGGTRNVKSSNPAAAVSLIPYTLGSAAGGAQYTPNTGVAQTAFTAGQAKTVTVYGSVASIPAGAEGQYSDTVTVALTW